MWEVIRKVQGLSPNECAFDHDTPEQRVERNLRCLLLHEVKPNVPEMDPKTFTLPYDDLVFVKIRRWASTTPSTSTHRTACGWMTGSCMRCAARGRGITAG